MFVLQQDTLERLRGGTLLLDANVLFDAWRFKNEFTDLLATFSEIDCYLTSTQSVLLEFLGGTNDASILKDKVQFLEVIFGNSISTIPLPLQRYFPADEDILRFSRQTNKFSLADFELFLTLKKYAHSGLLLMTRNHSDFTLPTFQRCGYITLLGKKEVQTHGIYQFVH